METVYLLDKLPDGTYHIGNSYECEVEEAIELIRNKQAKHELAPIGELPSHLLIGGGKKAVEAEEK